MPKTINRKCQQCAFLDIDESRSRDCWVEKVCRERRKRYRSRNKINQRQKDNYAISTGRKPPQKFDLEVVGNYFLILAQELNEKSHSFLKNWQAREYGAQACIVPHDWADWLKNRLVQQVSVNFLQKYSLVPDKLANQYPETRITTELEINADNAENLKAEITDLIQIAHAEDIENWTIEIKQVFTTSEIQKLTFSELQQKSNLFSAKIYLALLLSGEFLFIQEKFYQDLLICLPES
jgi:chromatin segregation and condensation protein Rec8/ScpA/Scc1 (kleisin family)